MIYIYNETKAAWGSESINNSVLRLTKTKTRANQQGTEKKRSIGVISYAQLFENVAGLKKTFDSLKMTQEPVVISDKSTSIMFNHKEFKPVIVERTQNIKNVLLGSIFLQGKKIINVRNDHTFLLEFFMLGAEFSFITSFNKENSQMTVDLLEEATGVITQYKFQQVNGQVVVSTTERQATEKEKSFTYRVKSFRPSRPTQAILVHEYDLAELSKTIDGERHHIVVYQNLEEAMAGLVAQNYKAVTLFVKAKFRGETEIEKKRYEVVTKKLCSRFKTVFKVHVDGKVDKVQY